MDGSTHLPALVIGAGPAGLATSCELRERGIAHLVLERGATVGQNWAHLYDSLRLHTGKHLSSLPRCPLPRETPLFPTRQQFLTYLIDYRDRFDLPVALGREVTAVRRDGDGWRVETAHGDLTTAAVVIATGIMANPHLPLIAGREHFGGDVLQSIDYRRPDPYRGKRVLVVGVGNSGSEIAAELAAGGAAVAVAVRSGVSVVPLTLFGVPIQYLSYAVGKLPAPLDHAVPRTFARLQRRRQGPPVLPPSPDPARITIPLIGFHLVDAIRSGRVGVRGDLAAFTRDGVRFRDGAEEPLDVVLFATGYRAALGILGEAVGTDARGFALRRDRVISRDQPGLFFVGHNYDTTGGLLNIRRDARLAARAIARFLSPRGTARR